MSQRIQEGNLTGFLSDGENSESEKNSKGLKSTGRIDIFSAYFPSRFGVKLNISGGNLYFQYSLNTNKTKSKQIFERLPEIQAK